jgi:predicted alpha/beta hydrolase
MPTPGKPVTDQRRDEKTAPVKSNHAPSQGDDGQQGANEVHPAIHRVDMLLQIEWPEFGKIFHLDPPASPFHHRPMGNGNTSSLGVSPASEPGPVDVAGFRGRIFRPSNVSGERALREVRGRMVMVHGLNLDPATMDPLSEWFASQGFVVARVELRGHRDSYREFIGVRHEDWQADVASAVAALNRLEPSVVSAPLFGVGFSLGGLLLAHHVRRLQVAADSARAGEFLNEREPWAGLVLLAPAFVPRLGSGFPLGILPRWLPYFSFTPGRYRRWPFCPHNAYLATGSLMRSHLAGIKNLQTNEYASESPARPRCLVLIHPRDELVHAGRLVNPDFGAGFGAYEVQFIQGVHRKWSIPRHLICHPDAFHAEAWGDVCQRMLAGLSVSS